MSARQDAAEQPKAFDWRSFPPFYEHLDLKLESLGGGKALVRLPYAKHFGNSRGEADAERALRGGF